MFKGDTQRSRAEMLKKPRDIDEAARRKRAARQRFKRLVNTVVVNQAWMDDVEEQGIVMNAKRNVAFLIRQKRKTGILTVAEKALLRMNHALRTVEERKKLCMIVSGLPCFDKFPPKLRVRLIPYLKFITLAEDRYIIKQEDIPLMVYFIVSGEVEMKKSVYDKMTKKVSVISEAIMGTGDVIGELEFLEYTTRLNSFVTLSTCELLFIMEQDYFNVVGGYLRKQWAQKKEALSSLSYFDFFTEEQIVRACSYCQLVKYDPLESIYSEDRGAVSCVHFVLSGQCDILQCLLMSVYMKNGVKTFKLVAVKGTDQNVFAQPSRTLRSYHSSVHGTDLKKEKSLNIAELLASTSDSDGSIHIKRAKRKVGLRDIEMACGLDKIPPKLLMNKDRERTAKKRYTPDRKASSRQTPRDKGSAGDTEDSYYSDFSDYLEDQEESYEYGPESLSEHSLITVQPTRDSTRRSLGSDTLRGRSQSPADVSRTSRMSNRSAKFSLKEQASGVMEYLDDSSSSSGVYRSRSQSQMYSDTRFSQILKPTKTRNETFFIDVGSMTHAGIFGLGENITHRVIMARTVVQCLLLPRFWLLEPEQNPGQIWKRRKFYLETCIPSREEVFQNFLKTRRWEKFKTSYVQSQVGPQTVNGTHPEDIPILARIIETRESEKAD